MTNNINKNKYIITILIIVYILVLLLCSNSILGFTILKDPKKIVLNKFNDDFAELTNSVSTHDFSNLEGYKDITVDSDGNIDFTVNPKPLNIFSSTYYGVFYSENDFLETPAIINWKLAQSEEHEYIAFEKVGNSYHANFGENKNHTYTAEIINDHWYLYQITWK